MPAVSPSATGPRPSSSPTRPASSAARPSGGFRGEPARAFEGSALHEVTDADTAAAVGSGDVPVLGTPRLIAWMEAVTVRSAAPLLGPGETTVGTGVRVEHRRATPVGGSVAISARSHGEPSAGRWLTFVVTAVDGSGRVVAGGEIDRAIVVRDRFLAAASDVPE